MSLLNIDSHFFSNCLRDLKEKKSSLTSTEYRYTKEVVIALHILFNDQTSLIKISSEKERNFRITKITNLIAEPGLIPGKSEEEIQNSIATRLMQFKEAYLSDRSRNETLIFFKSAFIGPPCFNGRLITMQHYMHERQGYKPEMFYEYQTKYDDQASQWEEMMYKCIECLALSEEIPPSFEQLKTFSLGKPVEFKKFNINLENENARYIYNRACQFFVE